MSAPAGEDMLAWAFVPLCQGTLRWWQLARVFVELAFWIALGACATGRCA